MTTTESDHPAKAVADTAHKLAQAPEMALKADAAISAKAVNVAEHTIKGAAEGGDALAAGFQELAKAYQAMATRNAERLTSSIKAFSAIKTPIECVELQRSLVMEAFDTAVSDFGHISKLTTTLLAGALTPMQKSVEALHATARN